MDQESTCANEKSIELKNFHKIILKSYNGDYYENHSKAT